MTKQQKNEMYPAVMMLMGQHCAFCGPMMQILTDLMKSGQIGELCIINIEKQPEIAQKLGVRSVPWLQIGPFELAGARSKQEISEWLERASSFDGISDYLEEVLAEGNLDFANRLIDRYQQALERGYDAEAYAEELQKAGYATDPEYARKINRVRNTEELQTRVSELKAELKNLDQVPLT